MKKWFTAGEIDKFAAPGFPRGRSHIAEFAQRESLIKKEKATKNGRPSVYYHISSFPQEAQDYIKQRLMEESPSYQAGILAAQKLILSEDIDHRIREGKKSALLAQLGGLPEEELEGVHAKVDVVSILESLKQDTNLPWCRLYEKFEFLYNNRELSPSPKPETYTVIPKVSAKTVERWRLTLEKSGAGGLLDRRSHANKKKRRFKIEENDEIKTFVLGLLYKKPKANSDHFLKALRTEFKEDDIPSRRAIRRFLENWKRENIQLYTALCNPDKWKSSFQAAHGNASEEALCINHIWELDTTPGDVMLDGGRYQVLGVIDVFTRRLKLHVVKNSTAMSVAAILRRALLDWGTSPADVTPIWRMDNGQDYKSNHVQLIMVSLGVQSDYLPPFSPEKKPHIESAFKTFNHGLVEILDDYIGHNVAERRAIEASQSFAQRLMKKGELLEIRMSPDAFQSFCDKWTDTIYQDKPHKGLNGATPRQKATDYKGKPIRTIGNPRELDILLAPIPGNNGVRTVYKKGIKVKNHYYSAPELGGLEGTQVYCKYNEADAGQMYVFGCDGKFVCIVVCPELVGMSLEEKKQRFSEAKRKQKRKIREGKRELEQMAKSADVAGIVEKILGKYTETAAKMRHLPIPSTPFRNDNLDAASDAVAALDNQSSTIELRRENDPDTRAGIARLRSLENRDKYARPDEWDSIYHHHQWCFEVARANRYDLMNDSDWQFIQDFEVEKGRLWNERIPPRECKYMDGRRIWFDDQACYDWIKSLRPDQRYGSVIQDNEWEIVKVFDRMFLADVRYEPVCPEYRQYRDENPFGRPPWVATHGWGNEHDCYKWALSLPEDKREEMVTDREWDIIDKKQKDMERNKFRHVHISRPLRKVANG